MTNYLKLTIELVPKSCWFSNLRSNLSKEQWDSIKKESFLKANYRCQICNGVGDKWPVECHEIWSYNDKLKIQTLTGTIALCPKCHMVKHIGLAKINGNFQVTKEHFKRINNLNETDALFEINQSFKVFAERSKSNWILDASIIEQKFNITFDKK